MSEGRTAILVVDDCPSERHIKLVERLPADPGIKLVTIGDLGPAFSREPVIGVAAVDATTAEEFLKANYPLLSAEARRFVADHSRGNMRWTIVLADRVAVTTEAQAADVIARNDIVQFVSDLLPEGRDFFCSTVLALLERVGWDGELRYQLELLASFAGVEVAELESAASQLSDRGLLNKLGRYRSVTPHPLAVYLAAEGWRGLAGRIVSELVPALDEGMALGLFRRVAELGRFEPARSVLPQLLAADGPFGSMARLEENGLGRVLTQLAIVLPDEVALHLREVVEEVDREGLLAMRASRRDLVWTLEKLAWHTRTFEVAANTLLKLALAENETYANNATGTWTDFFGAMLPGTAARPTARVEYLQRIATSPDADVRALVVAAAARALVPHESITVSGELQGGVLVEPRGTPETWGEVGAYRDAMIRLLVGLTADPDPAVATSAEDALIAAMHPIIDDRFSGEALTEALVGLRGDALRRLRAEAEHLISLYERHDREDRSVRERLQELLERLPEPSAAETVQILSRLRRWDFAEGTLQRRLVEALQTVPAGERAALLADILAGDEVPAAWEVGYAAAAVELSTDVLALFVGGFTRDPDALLGYLARAQDDTESAFDDFLDSDVAKGFALRDRLAIAVRGPATARARERIMLGVRELTVASAAAAVFGWHRNLDETAILTLLRDWVSRVDSQQDYNALVDWLNLVLHPEGAVPDLLREEAWRLIELRREFPDVGRESWDWTRLASGFAEDRPHELGVLIVELVDTRQVMLHEGDDQSKLLAQCAAADARVWEEISSRLEAGSWLLQMELRGWFLHNVPAAVVDEWVGDDLDRARIAASIAPVGGAEPSRYARFLLDRFGEDEQVRSSLYGSLVAGFWTGNESDRISRQIEQLTMWRASPDEPAGVRAWAREVVASLEKSRQQALQREAEEHY